MKLVATIPVSNCHIATKSGETMIFDEVVDLSAYAGALGNTPYYIEIIDGSSVEASAWIASAGGGEALGAELLTNTDFDSGDTGWIKGTGWTIADQGGGDYQAVASSVAISTALFEVITGSIGSLIKASATVSAYTSGSVSVYARNEGFLGNILTGTGTSNAYYTHNDASMRTGVITRASNTTLKISSITHRLMTDIPATGLHLVSEKDGITRNLEANAGINPNNITTIKIYSMDAAGTTTDITSNQATLNAEITGAGTARPVGISFYDASDDSLLNTVTELTGLSGKVHLATKDGEAMVFVDGEDLSSFAGSDSGNTPNLMILEDSSGNICASFCGAVGGGEALGAEYFDDPGFDNIASWSATHANVSFAGSVATFATVPAGNGLWDTIPDVSNGSILKLSIISNSYTSGQYRLYMLTDLVGSDAIASSGTHTRYRTATSASGGVNGIVVYLAALTASFTDISLKPLTDVPATGLHLIDQPDGNTRNIAYKDTNFNPNAVVTIKIFNRFTLGDDSDTFDWTSLDPGTAYSWYPKADDGTLEVTGDTVNFTTNTKPYASSLSPADGTEYNAGTTSVTLQAQFNDDEGGSGSLRFYDASDNSLIGTASGVNDGTTGSVNWTALEDGTTYQFYVIPNDGTEDGSQSSTISFTIKKDDEILGTKLFVDLFIEPINNTFDL